MAAAVMRTATWWDLVPTLLILGSCVAVLVLFAAVARWKP